MQDRYVLLGVAPVRVDWFRRVGQWAASASIPAEYVRCVSIAEVRARLASGQPYSALLVDAGLAGVDRELVAAAAEAGAAVLVVDDADVRPWTQLGAAAVLPSRFDRERLLDALHEHARLVGGAAAAPAEPVPAPSRGPRGAVVAVTGAGGVGASVTAIALAQGLARRSVGEVLLADLCRAADQAMLHDARVLVPSVQELVEAHRGAVPRVGDVRAQTFEVPERGYRLLLGLRQPKQWPTIRSMAFAATLDSLQQAFDVVVADVEPDLEGEQETGSFDVEERHLMARAAAARASAVVVVGRVGMKGLHAQTRVVLDLLQLGVPPDRIVPALLPAPRSPRERAEITAALADLVGAAAGGAASSLPGPLFLPRRRVDDALRDGLPLPKPLPDRLAAAVGAVLNRSGQRPADAASGVQPARITPGSLPLFTSQEGSP